MIFNLKKFKREISALAAMKESAPAALHPLRKIQIKEAVLAQIKNEASETSFPGSRYIGQERRNKMIKYIATSLIGLALVSGTAFAANSAKPGDPLFGVKQATENIEMHLAFSDQQKAALAAKFANERASELDEVSANANQNAQANQNIVQARNDLSSAIATLSNVETKLQAKGNGNSAAAIARVIIKLKAREQENENRVKIEGKAGQEGQENQQEGQENSNEQDENSSASASTSSNATGNVNITLPNSNGLLHANQHSELRINGSESGQ